MARFKSFCFLFLFAPAYQIQILFFCESLTLLSFSLTNNNNIIKESLGNSLFDSGTHLTYFVGLLAKNTMLPWNILHFVIKNNIIEIARYLVTEVNILGHALLCQTYPLHQHCINYHCCLVTILIMQIKPMQTQ